MRWELGIIVMVETRELHDDGVGLGFGVGVMIWGSLKSLFFLLKKKPNILVFSIQSIFLKIK